MKFCQTCSYFKQNVIGDGMCRRYPKNEPKSTRDWCGEYVEAIPVIEPKPEPKDGIVTLPYTPEPPPKPKKGKAK